MHSPICFPHGQRTLPTKPSATVAVTLGVIVAVGVCLLVSSVPTVSAAPATVLIRGRERQAGGSATELDHPPSLASRLSSRASGSLSTLKDWHAPSFRWIWSWHPFASMSSSHQVQQRAIAFFECQQHKAMGTMSNAPQIQHKQDQDHVTAIPPPPTPQGFVLNAARGSIQITAFLDPLCPDSADFWAGFAPAAKEFAPVATFRTVVLPLPYHRNAFVISQGLHAVHRRIVPSTAAAGPIVALFDYSFSHIEALSSRSQTVSELEYRAQTANWIWQALSPETRRNVFLDSYETLLADLQPGTGADQAARTHFKYTASLGVTGTPEVQVNGVLDAKASEIRTLAEWKEYISLLTQRTSQV